MQTRISQQPRKPDTSTMKTNGPRFVLDEADILARFHRVLANAAKPAKRGKRRERL